VAGVCLFSLTWAVPSQAADEEPGTGQLAEVVVTSNRLGEQDLQKTPITVTSLDTNTLDRTGLDSLADITRNVPGINVTDFGGGQNVIIIRGVTTDGLPVNTDNETQPTVSVYLDDTPISLAGATPDLRVGLRPRACRGRPRSAGNAVRCRRDGGQHPLHHP
jgi:outer membrane receptor for ferrienterochelin and colicin